MGGGGVKILGGRGLCLGVEWCGECTIQMIKKKCFFSNF